MFILIKHLTNTTPNTSKMKTPTVQIRSINSEYQLHWQKLLVPKYFSPKFSGVFWTGQTSLRQYCQKSIANTDYEASGHFESEYKPSLTELPGSPTLHVNTKSYSTLTMPAKYTTWHRCWNWYRHRCWHLNFETPNFWEISSKISRKCCDTMYHQSKNSNESVYLVPI